MLVIALSVLFSVTPVARHEGSVAIDFSPLGEQRQRYQLTLLIVTKDGSKFEESYSIGAREGPEGVRALVRTSMEKAWLATKIGDKTLVIHGHKKSAVTVVKIKAQWPGKGKKGKLLPKKNQPRVTWLGQ